VLSVAKGFTAARQSNSDCENKVLKSPTVTTHDKVGVIQASFDLYI